MSLVGFQSVTNSQPQGAITFRGNKINRVVSKMNHYVVKQHNEQFIKPNIHARIALWMQHADNKFTRLLDKIFKIK